jgi:peroxiredoxin
MLKQAVPILILCLSFSLSAQQADITLRCELKDCVEEVLTLYTFNGGAFIPVQQATPEEDGAFEFKVPASTPRFYYVGTNSKNRLPLILGQEEKVVLRGPCSAIPGARFTQSKINNDYAKLKMDLNDLRVESSKLIRQYQGVFGEERAKVAEQMAAVDKKRIALLDSLKSAQPYFAKIVALNTYLSFQNNAGEYKGEIDYFANEYFRFADLNAPEYQQMPWVYEAFRNYTSTLISVRLSVEQQKQYLEQALARAEKGSGAHQLAISGVITTLSQKKHELFSHFAEQFVEIYEEKDPAAVASMKEELEKSRSFMVGGQAPDFTQQTPEGEAMSLSDLRGKVVLVDFWASWCGPCRRENPNVVKAYEKYKSQGFDVIGVSLDKSKDKWLGAIEKDGLKWHHVSDLKGWQNEVAGMYGVRSIPHTLLLDREGKILARNLRGPALENKLKELFE